MPKEKKNYIPDSAELAREGSYGIIYFALIYHFIILFVFFFLGVTPMFFFNIGSVTIFSLCILLMKKTKTVILPFIIAMTEVIVHQVLAEYFLGVNTSFHYFILVISTSAFIIFRNSTVKSLPFCIIPVIVFIGMEMHRNLIIPKYQLSLPAETIIKFTNITTSVLLVLYRILNYAKLTVRLEDTLQNEVSNLADEMQIKNQELIYVQNKTIFSLSNLVENRDSDTGKHIQRTSAYVRLLAEEAKKEGVHPEFFTANKIELLERAAPMHDIGKIVVSDSILKKPGKLTVEEYAEMQKHTTEGKRIIEQVLYDGSDEYKNLAADIATYHHEKWNGTGYPEHLKGEEIPFCARIMAIADVFDALVSPRCYKEPFSDDVAFEILRKDSGIHFDPVLADLFIKNREKVVAIKEELQD